MISHIHHINFLVRNLDAAIKQYQALLGLGEFIVDSLEGRAVKTARIMIGDMWLVLVQPVDKESVPARHLEKHGEGFFLLSFGTDFIDNHVSETTQRGNQITLGEKRKGLSNWTVADFKADDFFGAQFQLTEEKLKN